MLALKVVILIRNATIHVHVVIRMFGVKIDVDGVIFCL